MNKQIRDEVIETVLENRVSRAVPDRGNRLRDDLEGVVDAPDVAVVEEAERRIRLGRETDRAVEAREHHSTRSKSELNHYSTFAADPRVPSSPVVVLGTITMVGGTFSITPTPEDPDARRRRRDSRERRNSFLRYLAIGAGLGAIAYSLLVLIGGLE